VENDGLLDGKEKRIVIRDFRRFDGKAIQLSRISSESCESALICDFDQKMGRLRLLPDMRSHSITKRSLFPRRKASII
jgi:hypothetical protein